jgi:hypothetical protein
MEAVGGDWNQLSQLHFGAADLGDARRSRRLVKTAELIFKSPAGSLPEKLPKWADLMGLYRLLAAGRVTHQAVIEPHRQWTLQQMRQTSGVILLPHDTTELDYTEHQAVAAQLGQIGNGGGRGYLCHNTLAITPDKQVIGLAGQILRPRRKVPKGETARQKREHPDRESRLWADGCRQVGPAPAGALWVDICDRGSDSFEFLEYEHAHGRHYVIRSSKDRKLQGEDHVGLDRIHRTLHGYARDLPVLGTRQVQLGASTKKGSVARTATVSLAGGPVTLAMPAQPRGQCTRTSLDVWVIHVAEIDPPADASPVHWVLLSNVAAQTLEQISERVDWYGCRPIIEDYHKGMKSGVGIELPQLESADRLEPVIGLLSVVSAVLLQLRHAARQPQAHHTPATAVAPRLWVLLVASQAYGKPQRELSVAEFFVGVARLGGHLARKNDGPPGWQTLWRGWQRLHLLIEGAQAALTGKCV